LAAAGLDIAALGDSLELTSTFSYLGEQIWNFIEFYNKITQNNNFEGFQQYINMIPGLVGLDPSVPSLKRKQFINLQNQITRNIYQFRQLIIKAFVDTCLSDLDQYMHTFRQNLQKEIIQNNNETQLIKNYLQGKIPDIQKQYDNTIAKIRTYHQDVRLEFHRYEDQYQQLSG
jgi:hypothetical protein